MNKPLIYACSGCSNVGRIAHDIAFNLASDGLADMSCISGVVADVESMKAQVLAANNVIVIDGCDLGCTKRCLDDSNIAVEHYFVITALAIEKRDMWQDSLIDNSKALNYIYQKLSRAKVI